MKKNATQVPGYQASSYSQNDAGKLKTSTTGYTDIINLNLTTVTLCKLGTCSYFAMFVMVTKEESRIFNACDVGDTIPNCQHSHFI